ncbi:MAG: phenylalanine--tRNA ligase subunit beta, partial [Steroidobacteraceae bacterium]
ESIEPAAGEFRGVVVARILSVERHPQAEKLRVCRVLTGSGAGGSAAAPLQIVCGAANARAGLTSALARVGAVLPGGQTIAAAKLRGVESAGMLCSARELGLAEASEGILELPDDAPLGADLRKYLDLDDTIFEVSVTPNRGDAMSVLGIAREVLALTGGSLKTPAYPGTATGAAPATSNEARFPVSLQPGAGAARLAAQVMRGLDNRRGSPMWLRERLRRAGLRSISAAVDVTNYVMFDLGQPLHAYDLKHVRGGLNARLTREGEALRLLDGRDLALETGTLVIADEDGAVGLAGVMGGERSAISSATTDIVFEAAWFKPVAIARRARALGLQTDASQRFERGVDFKGQERALALACALLHSIAGGTADPVTVAELPDELPQFAPVPLRRSQLQRLLGMPVPPQDVEARLSSMGLKVQAQAEGWSAQPPSWRFDIQIEPDLIEEVVRLGGLDAVPEIAPAMPLLPRALDTAEVDDAVVLRTLAARGYQEVVTFGFVDPALQQRLFGDQPGLEQSAIELANPIAADLAVMRTSLLPGLISVARENLRRQQSRVRVCEIANRFVIEGRLGGASGGGFREQKMLAGLAIGSRAPEQWGSEATPVDFYDVRADLEALLALGGAGGDFSFEPVACGYLHPGRSARIVRNGFAIGHVGELHPSLGQALELKTVPILFEFDYLAAFRANLAQFREVSRYPQIRRDISLTVPIETAYASINERVSVAAGSLLKQLIAFDVYRGKGVELGRKSIALGLILQDLSRTLTDEDADRVVTAVVQELRTHLDARIRE